MLESFYFNLSMALTIHNQKGSCQRSYFFLFLILTFHNKESTAVTNKRMHMRQHAEHLGPSN